MLSRQYMRSSRRSYWNAQGAKATTRDSNGNLQRLNSGIPDAVSQEVAKGDSQLHWHLTASVANEHYHFAITA